MTSTTMTGFSGFVARGYDTGRRVFRRMDLSTFITHKQLTLRFILLSYLWVYNYFSHL